MPGHTLMDTPTCVYVGAAGCGVLAGGAVAGKEVSVTLWGDLAAFAAALAIVAHWHIGKQLRR